MRSSNHTSVQEIIISPDMSERAIVGQLNVARGIMVDRNKYLRKYKNKISRKSFSTVVITATEDFKTSYKHDNEFKKMVFRHMKKIATGGKKINMFYEIRKPHNPHLIVFS